MAEADIIARVLPSALDVDAAAWNRLLAQQSHPTPFMRHEYLAALESSGSATPRTGWTPRFMTLWQGDTLVAACPLYLKSHSYGEYVFDWAWASAYEQHGVPYYPKAVIAVPFTPVPGSRLLARDAATRALLVQAVCQWCEQEDVSSVHLLFASDDDVQTSVQQDLMLRHTVQFHWKNELPTLAAAQGEAATAGQPPRYRDFDHFLASLSQDKRKKIRQERRRVADARVTFRWSRGADISTADWDFFYCCYERTYLEHGNPPYLTRDFFARMAAHMPDAWLLFVGERDGRPIASSLIAIGAYEPSATGPNDSDSCSESGTGLVAYGRYWGALERVDCLHFEACYYQPLQWCIANGAVRFEGGAQGEHKMARALLPVQATSAHWLAHPAFAEAVQRFLDREGAGVENYLESLHQRLPFKQAP
ncbi:MAG: GNAT family N-acetyltransferase [Acidovorax sp. SCN 65-28]|uniref:GNAT family N-acetyltransferase n=1 Tax=Acidovorax sp. TaxID=1872122 RepID=UPI000869A5EC|nr:GNAT family N-acetyltransferase [Acidovorax sp.]MBN9627878.1 N-acetyltransferase [Acidovorax sp.]ODS77629.1 MAG: GNAT family N-acetyltransferase [Acidovorax sp. SCN 65-28]OJT99870.1 MAG: GNAT family N-acetyltransferase [Acidovorax sp. 65-7]